MYFSGKIEFGVINQSVSAFNHILGDVSLIIYQFQAISAFSAVIDRLGTDSFCLTLNIALYHLEARFSIYNSTAIEINYHHISLVIFVTLIIQTHTDLEIVLI